MQVAYDMEYLCFVNPVPGPLPQWMALGLPFLLETWLATMLTVVAGMLLFAFVANVGYLASQRLQKDDTTNKFNAADPVISSHW